MITTSLLNKLSVPPWPIWLAICQKRRPLLILWWILSKWAFRIPFAFSWGRCIKVLLISFNLCDALAASSWFRLTTITEKLYLSGLSLVPSAESWDSASDAWHLMQVRWTTEVGVWRVVLTPRLNSVCMGASRDPSIKWMYILQHKGAVNVSTMPSPGILIELCRMEFLIWKEMWTNIRLLAWSCRAASAIAYVHLVCHTQRFLTHDDLLQKLEPELLVRSLSLDSIYCTPFLIF